MSATNGDGGYVTRGRAGELERLMAEMEGRLMERLAGLEAELAAVRAFSLDVPRAQLEATLTTLRRYTGARPPERGGG